MLIDQAGMILEKALDSRPFSYNNFEILPILLKQEANSRISDMMADNPLNNSEQPWNHSSLKSDSPTCLKVMPSMEQEPRTFWMPSRTGSHRRSRNKENHIVVITVNGVLAEY